MHILSPFFQRDLEAPYLHEKLHQGYLFHTLPKTAGELFAYDACSYVIETIAPHMLRHVQQGIYPHLLSIKDTGDAIKKEDIQKMHKISELSLDMPICIIIEKIERMTDAAGNALLKLLEEPPSSVYFFCTTEHIQDVMPTLQSRLMVFHMSTPKIDLPHTSWNTDIQDLFSSYPAFFKEYLSLPEKDQLTYLDSLLQAMRDAARVLDHTASRTERHLGISRLWEIKEESTFPFFLEYILQKQYTALPKNTHLHFSRAIIALKRSLAMNAHKKLAGLDFLLSLPQST